MSQLFYISEYAGYDPIRPDGKSIVPGGFRPYPVFDPQRGVVKKGVVVLDTEKDATIITELEAFADFKKGFVKVSKLPTRANSEGNIISGVRTGHEDQKMIVADTSQIKADLGKKFQRYYELKKQLFNPNGSMKKGVPESEELTEFENLEQELIPKGE